MDCADKIKEIRKMSGMNRRDFAIHIKSHIRRLLIGN